MGKRMIGVFCWNRLIELLLFIWVINSNFGARYLEALIPK